MLRFAAAVGFFFSAVAPAVGQSGAAQVLEKHLQRAVTKASPAVAAVVVSRRPKPPDVKDLGDPENPPEYFGTGVLVEKQVLLTYFHLVRGATAIAVRLPPNGSESEPRIVAATIFAGDTRSDLATLRLAEPATAEPIELGRGESLQRGSLVACLCAPFTYGFRDAEAATAFGVVAALKRRLPAGGNESDSVKTIQQLGHQIQIDARIPAGSTGAAVVDLDGRLVGLIGDRGMSPGEALALPIDMGVRRVIEVLRRGEEAEYGLLGVTTDGRRMENNAVLFRDHTGRRETTGVPISFVTPNGPADRAGIHDEDVILAVNDQPIRDYDDMFLFIGMGMAGHEATIRVRRADSRRVETVKVRLAKYPLAEPGVATRRPASVLGLRVDYASVVSPRQQQGWRLRSDRQSDAPPMPEGVVVREVEKESPAERAGLVEYQDLITAVNGVATPTPADFYREAAKARSAGQPVILKLHGKPDVTLR